MTQQGIITNSIFIYVFNILFIMAYFAFIFI